MVLRDILNKAKSGSDAAEVYGSNELSMSVSFENNVIKDSNSSDLGGTAVRVIRDGKIGFSSSSEPGDITIADYAIKSAKYGKKAKFALAPKSDIKPFDITVDNFNEITEDFAIAECEKAVNDLKSVHPEALASSTIAKTLTNTMVLNSNGVDIEQKEAMIVWYCGLSYKSEGHFLQVYDLNFGDKFTGFDSLLNTVKEDFALCLKPVTVQPGKYRVLFTPKGMMHLLMIWTSCLNGLSVVKGISPWKDKTGEQLFDEKLTVRSNFTGDGSVRKLAFDDEGTHTGITPLIDKGVLKSFIHSRDTAAQIGQEPTGHGFRNSFAANPVPSSIGFEFEPGDSDLSEMMKDADFLVDDLIGSIMSNPYSGTISGNASMVFKMENGKKVSQIKNAMVSVNVFKQFKDNILAVSKEVGKFGMPPFFPAFKSPAYLLADVSISAK